MIYRKAEFLWGYTWPFSTVGHPLSLPIAVLLFVSPRQTLIGLPTSVLFPSNSLRSGGKSTLDYVLLYLISRGINTNRKEHTNGSCPYQKSMYTISGLPVLQLNNSEPETFTVPHPFISYQAGPYLDIIILNSFL